MPRKRPPLGPDLFDCADDRENRQRAAKRTPVYLTARQCKIAEDYADARALLALEYAREHLGGEAPTLNRQSVGARGGVAVHRPGVYGEYAGHLLTGLPWVPVHHGPIPRDAPDLGTWVDVKCRREGDHLLIHRKKKILPERAYVQCYAGAIDHERATQEGWPIYFAGFMWGSAIMANYTISDKYNTGRPGWWIPEADLPVIAELLDIVRRGGPPGVS
jgi:hypothetical protein